MKLCCMFAQCVCTQAQYCCLCCWVGTKLVHYNNNVPLSNAFHFCTESLQICLMDPYNMIIFVWPHYHVLAISSVDFLPDVNHIIFQRSYSIDNNLYKSVVFQHGRDTKEWIPELIFGCFLPYVHFNTKYSQWFYQELVRVTVSVFVSIKRSLSMRILKREWLLMTL